MFCVVLKKKAEVFVMVSVYICHLAGEVCRCVAVNILLCKLFSLEYQFTFFIVLRFCIRSITEIGCELCWERGTFLTFS